MGTFIPKWHRELELFSAVKPLLILEGNVTDKYRYPVAGSIRESSLRQQSQFSILNSQFSIPKSSPPSR